MRGLGSRRHRSLVNSVDNAPGRWNVVTCKDQKMIDEGWHRFWMNRGGSPKVRDDLVFGKRAKPRGH